jgi:hypothetical protein
MTIAMYTFLDVDFSFREKLKKLHDNTWKCENVKSSEVSWFNETICGYGPIVTWIVVINHYGGPGSVVYVVVVASASRTEDPGSSLVIRKTQDWHLGPILRTWITTQLKAKCVFRIKIIFPYFKNTLAYYNAGVADLGKFGRRRIT